MSNDDLTMRRAIFVYEAARLAARAANAPIVPVAWGEREVVFHLQFLAIIARQCSPQRSTSPEELHGSWMQAYFAMGWVYGEKYDLAVKTHPDLVPYAQLGQLERDKDAVFVALCEIARQWIYDVKPEAPLRYPQYLACPEGFWESSYEDPAQARCSVCKFPATAHKRL